MGPGHDINAQEPHDSEENEGELTRAENASKVRSGTDSLSEIGGQLRNLTDAVLGLSSAEDRRQFRQNINLLAYFEDLQSTLNIFAESVNTAADKAMTAEEKLLTLGSSDALLLRAAQGGAARLFTKDVDGWIHDLGEQVALVGGFFSALKKYMADDNQARISLLLNRKDPRFEPAQAVKDLDAEYKGLLQIIDLVRDEMCKFPGLCMKLAESVRGLHATLKKCFKNEDEEGEDQKNNHPVFLFFRPDPLPKFDVPIYKNNPHLTAVLAQLVEDLPQKPESKESDKVIKPSELSAYCEKLRALGDAKMLSWLRTQQMYMRMSRVLENLHLCYTAVNTALEKSGLAEIRNDNPSEAGGAYLAVMEAAKQRRLSAGGTERTFSNFEPGQILEFIYNNKPYTDPKAEVIESAEKESDRNQTYLKIFARLEKLLEDMSKPKGAPAAVDIAKEVLELVDLKSTIKLPEERRKRSSLLRDRKEGNYAFTVDQKSHGELELRRVPTYNVEYADVVGGSWRRVEELLAPLIRYGEMGYVFSHGSARGKSNNNMLIVGPYGCGKNMFLRALMADPRTVGVNVTQERLVSYWLGQAERNVRTLFELAYSKREQLDKPTVICWDEFDSLYPEKRKTGMVHTHSTEGHMQKVLQSVLDGDTIYDGVSLIALTNEPGRVPTPIFRRFANVVIIEALTEDERMAIIKNMLAGIPREEGFDDKVDWESFLERTNFASGDLLGKVYDKMFESFLLKFESTNPAGIKDANEALKQLVMDGKRVQAADRRRIFESHGSGVVLTAAEFDETSKTVLSRLVAKSTMDQQRLFYEQVEDRLKEAFGDGV